MKARNLVLSLVALLIVTFLCLAANNSGIFKAAAPADMAPIAKPAPGASQPPDGWLKLYDEHVALIAEIRELEKRHGIKERAERANEIARRLQRTIPAGTDFNPESRYFEPRVPPTALPPNK